EIYAVLVPPAGIEEVPGNPQQKNLRIVSLLMRMEAAPQLGMQFDAATQTETHTVEIPIAGGVDMTHAVGNVKVPVM
ncbi:MAG: hypothetical protein M1823_008997, partial [Watsoniomyces obsoletus]